MEKPVDREALLMALKRHNLIAMARERPLSVLIVDGDEGTRGPLASLLEESGFSVFTASDPEEGLTRAVEGRPDLVILDMAMSIAGGGELLLGLKTRPVLQDLPLILLFQKGFQLHEGEVVEFTKKARRAGLSWREDLLREIRKMEVFYPHLAGLLDPLTGIYNREYFERIIGCTVTRATTYGEGFSLMLIDIDNFTLYNHIWGRDEGDRLLKRIARIVEGSVRRMDRVVRYGDDEILCIFPGSTRDSVVKVGDSIRLMIEDADISLRRATVTIGIVYCPKDGKDISTLTERLEELVRRGQERGGNQICVV